MFIVCDCIRCVSYCSSQFNPFSTINNMKTKRKSTNFLEMEQRYWKVKHIARFLMIEFIFLGWATSNSFAWNFQEPSNSIIAYQLTHHTKVRDMREKRKKIWFKNDFVIILPLKRSWTVKNYLIGWFWHFRLIMDEMIEEKILFFIN